MEVPAKWAWSVVALSVLAGALWLTGKLYQPLGEPRPGVKLADSESNLSLLGAGKTASDAGGAGAAVAGPAGRTPDEVRDRLYATPMFKGSQPDGACLTDAAGQLKPDIALRRRFDYYLRDQSEVTLPEIRSLLAVDGCPGQRPAVVRQMLDMWDKYLRLQSYPYQHVASAGNPVSWVAAYEERQAVRREVLGAAWSEAFYADEDALLHKLVQAALGRGA